MSSMTPAPAAAGWFDRIADSLNAILVKETRQALKSRQFVAAFLLLLTGAWLVSLFMLLNYAGSLDYAPAGREFFTGFYFVLLAAVYVVVPFGAFRGMLAEREQNTFDVLSVTTVSPGQIVRGKLLSAIVQMFLYYSAITPFIAFASLLHGFDLAEAAFFLIISAFVSVGCSMAAIFGASLESTTRWPGLSSLAVLGGLVFLLFGNYGIALESMHFGGMTRTFRAPEFWWVMALLGVVWLTYFLLFAQLAAAALSPPSGNRSTGIRITCAAQYWLLWGMVFVIIAQTGGGLDPESLVVLASLSGLQWLIVGIFAATEGERLPRRVRRELPGSRLRRLLLVPFLPGGGRGYLYLVLHAVGLAALGVLFSTMFSTPSYWSYHPLSTMFYSLAVASQLVIYSGIACWLGRAIPRRWPMAQTVHVRLCVVVVIAAGTFLPLIAHLFRGSHRFEYMLTDILSPLASLIAFDDDRSGGQITEFVPAGPILVAAILLVNLPAMKRGVREVLSDEDAAA